MGRAQEHGNLTTENAEHALTMYTLLQQHNITEEKYKH